MANKYKITDIERLRTILNDNQLKYWKNIAVKIFKWKGADELGELVTSEIIEELLFDEGDSIFFKDDKNGFMCLKVSPYEYKNVNNKPTKFMATGVNYQKTLTLDNSVRIKNNNTAQSTKEAIEYYIDCITDCEITKKLRRNAHKTPFMLETTSETELSAKNIFKQIDTGEPAIYKNKSRSDGTIGVNVLNTDVAYMNDRLNDEINSYTANILTILGLDNYVEDKHERVQSAEVQAQQEYIISAFKSMLDERQQACEKINKMFGLNLSIEYVKGEQIEETEQDEEGEDNE